MNQIIVEAHMCVIPIGKSAKIYFISLMLTHRILGTTMISGKQLGPRFLEFSL